MIRQLLLVLAAASAAPAAPIVVVHAQDTDQDQPIADNRPEVKALVVLLAAQIDKKGKEDRDAIDTIDKLVVEFPRSGAKDREAIVQALSKCFDVKRAEMDEGIPNNQLYIAAAVALRTMGPESARVLMKWIDSRDHRKDVALQEKLIQSLGKTKDEAGRKFLLKLIDSPLNRIVAAAAEALGEYGGAEDKVRKETFEELLKALMSAKNAYDANTTDAILSERYNTIAAPIISSLQRLSGHEEHDPQEWQRWWNKNKKADWARKEG